MLTFPVVRLGSSGVTLSVDFYRKFESRTIEVNHVRTHTVLPAKPLTRDLLASESRPQDDFCFRHALSEHPAQILLLISIEHLGHFRSPDPLFLSPFRRGK